MTAPNGDQLNDLYRAYALCTAILFVKYVWALFYSANPGNHPEEDSMLNLPATPADMKRRYGVVLFCV